MTHDAPERRRCGVQLRCRLRLGRNSVSGRPFAPANLDHSYDLDGQRTSVRDSLAGSQLPATVSSAVYNADNQLLGVPAYENVPEPSGANPAVLAFHKLNLVSNELLRTTNNDAPSRGQGAV